MTPSLSGSRYVRSQKQEHFGITALRSNGSLYTDSSSKSENLNKQFKSVFTPPSLDKTHKLPGQPFPPIKDLCITEHGVYKLIDGIKTSKSSGPDGIPGKLFQSLVKDLAPVLRFIFEQSLLTGDLPIDRTRASLEPVFKKKHQVTGGSLPTCISYLRGVPRIWEGGGQEFFFRFVNFHVA